MTHLRLLFLFPCISLLACHGHSRTALANSLLGCYTLRAQPWKPEIPGGDAQFYVLPALLQLHSDTAPGLGYLPGARVATPPMSRDFLPVWYGHSRAFWWQHGADSLEVKWSDGYCSVWAHLRHHGDTLAGLAEAFADYPLPDESIPVTQLIAVRRPCP